MTPIPVDDVIFQFLNTSTHLLTPEMRRRFAGVKNNQTWREKCISRQLIQELGLLEYMTQREWFRVRLSPALLRRVTLGFDPTDDFSYYYSRGSYRIDVTARNLIADEQATGQRKTHRDAVLRYAKDITREDLTNVILCASRWGLNRKLKGFDGNHRLIAYYIRHQRLDPFECIVGFNRYLPLNVLQRSLLGFPVKNRLQTSIKFHTKQNLHRLKCWLSGGQLYQPILKDPSYWKSLADLREERPAKLDTSVALAGERPCLDRAQLIHADLARNTHLLAKPGARLLDIGCNIGFFCHYFENLGVRATGIDDSRHNRHQRFSRANVIDVARQLNQRYGFSATFHDGDAVQFLSEGNKRYDIVLLLSVFHHFFLGYALDRKGGDPMQRARDFIQQINRVTEQVLYLEYDEGCTELSTSELIEFLKNESGFQDIEIIGRSSDFHRPIPRCLRSAKKPSAELDSVVHRNGDERWKEKAFQGS